MKPGLFLTIFGTFFLASAVAFVVLPAVRTGCGTESMREFIRFNNVISQSNRAISDWFLKNDKQLETLHLVLPSALGAYPDYELIRQSNFNSTEARYDQSFGQLPYEEIVGGTIAAERIREEARRLGIDRHSWEYLCGIWFSKTRAEFQHEDPDVITVMVIHDFDNDYGERIVLGYASGETEFIHREDSEQAKERIEADRRARERLNLAPLPDEFRSWLLTGEPASVGDGTFVPPRLEEFP